MVTLYYVLYYWWLVVSTPSTTGRDRPVAQRLDAESG